MKQNLTIEQSAELIKRGVSESIVTTWVPIVNDRGFTYKHAPIFTLADVCALLPKEIVTDTIMCDDDVCPISIRWDTNCQKWFVGYDLIPHPVGVGMDSELIDALFSTSCWVIEKNFLTK